MPARDTAPTGKPWIDPTTSGVDRSRIFGGRRPGWMAEEPNEGHGVAKTAVRSAHRPTDGVSTVPAADRAHWSTSH